MKLNYNLIGEGKETVLFLHGWGANLNSFFMFKNLQNYKLLFVDFPGFGNSEKLKYSFNVFDYALEIFKLLKKLNILEVNIVCHSFGGRVAILLETIFNLKVNKIVFIASAGLKPRFNLKVKLKIISYKLKKLMVKLKLAKFNLNGCGSSDYVNLNSVEKVTFNKVINFNEKKYLNKIKCPTLLIWGSDDKSTPVYMAKIFNKKIKNSKLIILKNCNHFCFIQNKSVVIFEVENFLNS